MAAGPPVPLVREPRRSELVHGSDGLADLGLPAPEGKPLDEYGPAFIVRMLEESEEPTTIDVRDGFGPGAEARTE